MNGSTARIAAVALAAALSGTVAPAQQAREARRAVDYRHDPKASRHADEPAVPDAPELPEDLRVAVPAGGEPHVEAQRVGPPPARSGDLDELARRAADETAAEAARTWAWREYWHAGFARGVSQALADPRVGSWDRNEGFRFGRLDPDARAMGERLAADAARQDAGPAADRIVAGEFTDLSHEPRRDPTPPAIAFDPAGPFVDPPQRDDVFASLPIVSARGLSARGREVAGAWRVRPADLARGDRRAGYDAGWADPEAAFSVWRGRQRPGSPWSRTTGAERDRFHEVFVARFRATLGTLDLRPAAAGWRDGFGDGWRYGAAIQAEWKYRQGYAEGFDLGVREVASTAYPYAFAQAYRDAYDSAFHAWSSSAHPAIEAVRLDDANGDGIFEPGEGVLVDADLVNYGGAPGTFDLRATGGDVDREAIATVRLPARRTTRLDRPVMLSVSGATPIRRKTAITLVLGDATIEAPLYVSRPLEIEGEPRITADRLAGKVRLRLDVVNRSRRNVSAVARAELVEGLGRHQDADLGTVPAGGRATATFDYEGLPPLDLISGSARWSLATGRGGAPDDARVVAIAPTAADLGSDDLLDYMLSLARAGDARPSDVRRARALLLERLRADWARACAADGNPYKRDYASKGVETSLGVLVREVQAARRSLTRPEVFTGIGSEIAVLADDLPGAHPLLRKWMKKLATRLG